MVHGWPLPETKPRRFLSFCLHAHSLPAHLPRTHAPVSPHCVPARPRPTARTRPQGQEWSSPPTLPGSGPPTYSCRARSIQSSLPHTLFYHQCSTCTESEPRRAICSPSSQLTGQASDTLLTHRQTCNLRGSCWAQGPLGGCERREGLWEGLTPDTPTPCTLVREGAIHGRVRGRPAPTCMHSDRNRGSRQRR